MSRASRRYGAALVVVLALSLVIGLWWSAKAPVSNAQAASVSQDHIKAASPKATPQPAARRLNNTTSAGEAPAAPVAHELTAALIASVKVDRERVCVGEPVEVSVELFPHAREARVAINATSGDKVVLNPRQLGRYPIIVFAHGWDGELDSRTEHIEVEDCSPLTRHDVSARPAPGEEDTFDFEIDRIEGLGEIEKVRWDFGDGSPVQETSELTARRSYWDRPQQGPHASYVVTVEVIDRAGLVARAKLHLSMINDAWVLARGGVLELPMRRVGLPWRAADGRVSVEVELRPIQLQDKVRLVGAQVIAHACDGEGERVTQRGLSAAQLLDVVQVEGSRATRATLSVPVGLSQGRCRWAVELYGEQADGRALTARTSFDLGAIGAESQVVRDRARAKASFEAMIKQAKARRGR